MSVFYKWIKGAYGSQENPVGRDSGAWTTLTWSSSSGDTCASLPTLAISNGCLTSDAYNLGYILSNKATNIVIEPIWRFNSGFYLGEKDDINFAEIRKITPDDSGVKIGCSVKADGAFTIKDTLTILSGNVNINAGKLDVHGAIDTKSNLTVNGYSNLTGKLTVEDAIETKSSMTIKSFCQAAYFNATSDQRAKTDIQTANFSSLDVISKIPVYTFRYKDAEDVVIGIMAQDLLEHQPGNLSLVSNANAEGVDGDYMSIKQDKVVFLLWKAIQELQNEIDELKKALN